MQKKVFLVLLILMPFFISAQNEKKIDSLLDAYNTQANDTSKVKTITLLYNSLLYQDINSAKKYANEELLLSKKLNYQKGIASGNYHLGVYYNNIDEIDSAKTYYTKSLKIYDNLNDNISKANVNHGFAILEYSSGNFEHALTILADNITFYLKKPIDSSSLAITYVLKGSIYRQQGKYKLAIKESINALKIYEILNDDIRKADALGLLATLEFSLENYPKSLDYNKQALKIYKKYNDIEYSAQALNDIGNTYYYLENYIEALKKLAEFLKRLFLHQLQNRLKRHHECHLQRLQGWINQLNLQGWSRNQQNHQTNTCLTSLVSHQICTTPQLGK